MHYINLIIKHSDKICEAITALWGALTLLGLITPSNDKKGVMSVIGRVFDRLGINIKGK